MRARRLLRALVLLASAAACAACAAADQPAPITSGRIAPGAHAQDDAGAAWQPVSLPDHWGRMRRGGVWTYRIDLGPCPAAPAGCLRPGPMGLSVPRAGSRLELWINGALAASFGSVQDLGPGGGEDHSLHPVWVDVSPALLRPRGNELRIVVSGKQGLLPGLSRVYWGAAEELRARHLQRERAVVGGSVAVAWLSALFAAAGLTAALTVRRGARAAAWLFTVCASLWSLRELLRLSMDLPGLPFEPRFAGMSLALGFTVICGALLLLQLLRMQRRWQAVLAAVLALAGAGLALDYLGRLSGVGEAAGGLRLLQWLQVVQVLATLTGPASLWHWWRQRNLSNAWLAVGCIGISGLGAADTWRLYLTPDPLGYEHLRLTSYMALWLLVAISAAAFVRVNRALHLEAVHKQELEREVLAQRTELEALHARERERAAASAVDTERTRIMRDMHDGLGSQLVGLLSTVQSGDYTNEELTREVREAIDQLRLTIDTLEPMGDDLSSLLGQLRFRLEPRLKRVGIRLDWQVGELPGGERLGTQGLASLQRLLFEVFSNIIKHAGATQVTVQATHQAWCGSNQIVIADDGRGFDAQAAHAGRGLDNMRERARQLGAELEISASAGAGTRVRLGIGALTTEG